MSYKYKNNSGQNAILPGIGYVLKDDEIETNAPLENPNFELISDTNNNNVVATEAPQPNAVIDATPADTTTAESEVK